MLDAHLDTMTKITKTQMEGKDRFCRKLFEIPCLCVCQPHVLFVCSEHAYVTHKEVRAINKFHGPFNERSMKIAISVSFVQQSALTMHLPAYIRVDSVHAL